MREGSREGGSEGGMREEVRGDGESEVFGGYLYLLSCSWELLTNKYILSESEETRKVV